jgi:hypothetical protein
MTGKENGKGKEKATDQTASETNEPQVFSARYLDRSRLESLLTSLHGPDNFSVHLRLDNWVVFAPARLTAVGSGKLIHDEPVLIGVSRNRLKICEDESVNDVGEQAADEQRTHLRLW